MSSRTDSSGVAPSSQNVWQRYMPRSPLPSKPSALADAQRGVDGLRAHAVLLRPRWSAPPGCRSTCAPCRSGGGRRSACRSAGRGCRRASWSAIGALLLGRVPAGQRDRHRVVRRRERDLVERAVAQLVVPVAAAGGRRGGRRAAGAEEARPRRRRSGRGRSRRPRPGAGRRAARRRRAGARPRAAGGPVDEPQDRGHALVDQVDAERGQQQREDRVALRRCTSTPAATKAAPRSARRRRRSGSRASQSAARRSGSPTVDAA